jgi:hypothetical protein
VQGLRHPPDIATDALVGLPFDLGRRKAFADAVEDVVEMLAEVQRRLIHEHIAYEVGDAFLARVFRCRLYQKLEAADCALALVQDRCVVGVLFFDLFSEFQKQERVAEIRLAQNARELLGREAGRRIEVRENVPDAGERRECLLVLQ